MNNFEEHNKTILNWTPKVRAQLKSTVVLKLQDGKGKSPVLRPGRTELSLSQSITYKIWKKFDVIDRVSFNFERHGVFVHKGVGSGYEMGGGKVIRTAITDSGTHRQPVEWFNPVLEQMLPELANRLAEVNADAVLNASRIMIK